MRNAAAFIVFVLIFIVVLVWKKHDVIEKPIYKLDNAINAVAYPVKVLVVYSNVKALKIMANGVKNGVITENGNASLRMKSVHDANFEDVLWANAVIIGSPVYNGNVDPKIQSWINSWDFRADLSMKIGAAFATGGGISAGEETVMLSLLRSMLIFSMVVTGGGNWQSAFGASAIVDEKYIDSMNTNPVCTTMCVEDKPIVAGHFLKKANMLGSHIARTASKLARL